MHELVDEFFAKFVHEFMYEIRMNFLHEKLVMLRMTCTVPLSKVDLFSFNSVTFL